MTACPACDANSSAELETLNGFQLHRCLGCDLTYCDPMTAGDSDYYKDHIAYKRVTKEMALQSLATANIKAHRQLLARMKPGRALDLGCGYGAFTALAVRAGLDAYGIDFNSQQIEAGRRAFGLGDRLYAGRVEDAPELFREGSNDLVTMFEVIEHVEDPRALLRQAYSLLKAGGTLALSCPNEARWMPMGRVFVDYPPHHLTRWSPGSLGRLLKALGFVNVSFVPDASWRDLIWTAYVNRSAAAQTGAVDVEAPATDGARRRTWKHAAYDLAGVALKPADLVLRALNVGTMGMHVYARKPIAS